MRNQAMKKIALLSNMLFNLAANNLYKNINHAAKDLQHHHTNNQALSYAIKKLYNCQLLFPGTCK